MSRGGFRFKRIHIALPRHPNNHVRRNYSRQNLPTHNYLYTTLRFAKFVQRHRTMSANFFQYRRAFFPNRIIYIDRLLSGIFYVRLYMIPVTLQTSTRSLNRQTYVPELVRLCHGLMERDTVPRRACSSFDASGSFFGPVRPDSPLS